MSSLTYDTHLPDFANLFSLKGKVAVITGGSRGLGLHAASAFLQAGCSLVFITARKASALTAAADQLNTLISTSPNSSSSSSSSPLTPNAKAIPIPADLSTIQGIEHLVSEVSKHTSHIDILFANAGATWGARFDEHPDEAFEKVMGLNVQSVFGCVRLFAPLLQARATLEDPSRVIVTASIAGHLPSSGPTPAIGYSTSKAAAIHLARNLALELGPRHINVNSISPGFFPSKMASVSIELQGGAEKLALDNPNGRIGRPEDIAGAVVFLASRAGGHVNGADLKVDGGRWLGGVAWRRRGGDGKGKREAKI